MDSLRKPKSFLYTNCIAPQNPKSKIHLLLYSPVSSLSIGRSGYYAQKYPPSVVPKSEIKFLECLIWGLAFFLFHTVPKNNLKLLQPAEAFNGWIGCYIKYIWFM